MYERMENSGNSVEGAAGSEKPSPHEVGTHIIIWWVSPLSGDVGTSVDGPVRALEGEQHQENKIIFDEKSHLWKSRYLGGFFHKMTVLCIKQNVWTKEKWLKIHTEAWGHWLILRSKFVLIAGIRDIPYGANSDLYCSGGTQQWYLVQTATLPCDLRQDSLGL